jgi:uncharacterized membrane protein YozB (DUF420 family)
LVSVFQIDLVFQIATFAMLAVGMLIDLKRKIEAQAQLMLAAVVLNIFFFVAIMGPAGTTLEEKRLALWAL